jgi:heptosyltransferase-2/heptosyltransferase-3
VKQWLTHRWPSVIRHLQARDLRVVLTGGRSERELCAEIASHDAAVTDLAGTTSLEELIELLRMARIVIGPDSGPLHLAVATSTPSVHLFGPADFRRYGPWGDPRLHRVVDAGVTCPQCGDLSPTRAAGCGCMLAITTTVVQQALDEVLAATESRALDVPR